ncbi:IclR family transcriptional regulator [Variovorax fucosicus]|uniref:IclR family transcriptional regulator n=1 Tax=Variovorax fucosicus TaxID=3053517 RepID=UPI002574FED3|nr:IclR family transcriptional regulator [Variovorax sp. J22G47]MDM0055883.1 IclR family transcriptional regulator [Variovorax sp. J22G47]
MVSKKSAPVRPVEDDAPPADPLFNQSLEKGLAVLHAFDGAHRTMTLAEVAARAGMSKASAQRTVHTLQVLGYVGKHEQTRRFQLRPKIMDIGFNYLASHPLVQVANPYLAQLANASGETASLTEPVELDMLYVAQRVTSQFIPVSTPVGMRIPMYCTSSGRAWLSSLPTDEARAMLQRSRREARTPATLTNVNAILARVAACRKLGYAYNAEELFLGDMGIAAPIIDGKGRALGAVHVAPPTSRWSLEAAQKKLAPMVIECARAISSAISH